MFRYHNLPTHTTEVLDLTSLTVDEFTALVPPFEDAFLAYMPEWTLHARLFGMRLAAMLRSCANSWGSQDHPYWGKPHPRQRCQRQSPVRPPFLS